MKTSKHTPGPWISESNGSDILIYEKGGGAYKHDYDCIAVLDANDTNAESNAKLISCAPELLWILKAVTQLLHETGLHNDSVEFADKIIKKAEGHN